MERNDLDAIELSAQDAARAVGMPYRTVLNWLDTGVVDGRQELNLRRYTTVGALRTFLATRGPAGERAIAGLEEYVIRYVMPKDEKGGGIISTDVLALV